MMWKFEGSTLFTPKDEDLTEIRQKLEGSIVLTRKLEGLIIIRRMLEVFFEIELISELNVEMYLILEFIWVKNQVTEIRPITYFQFVTVLLRDYLALCLGTIRPRVLLWLAQKLNEYLSSINCPLSLASNFKEMVGKDKLLEVCC